MTKALLFPKGCAKGPPAACLTAVRVGQASLWGLWHIFYLEFPNRSSGRKNRLKLFLLTKQSENHQAGVAD